MSLVDVSLSINGKPVSSPVSPRTHLADFLREEKLLTGTHLGCEQGVCGACTLMVDGRPVRSCITLAVACDGSDVRTVEGFDDDPLMAVIRDAFSRHHGLQCGFCTPGMLATAYDIVRRLPDADDARIRRELSGNLCRCTGYTGIVAAIRHVLDGDAPSPTCTPLPRTNRTEAVGTMDGAASVETPADASAPPAGDETPATVLDLDADLDGVTLTRRLPIAAPPEDVWPVVSDVSTVVECIPGASLNAPVAGGTFKGRCVVSLGPMKAQFHGDGAVRMDDAARSGRVVGKGRDSLTRSNVDGILDFRLTADGDGQSILDLEMTYRLQGPLAQFGRKALVEEVADRILSDAAAALTARATGADADTPRPRSMNGLAVAFAVFKGILRRMLPR